MSKPASPNRSPGYTPDMITGLAAAAARTIFFTKTKKIAIFLFCYVTIMSVLPNFYSFDSDGYFVQKHNIFNQYGTKLGWFWTLVVVTPFVFITSTANGKDRLKSDLGRISIATLSWYLVTTAFHSFLEKTSYCKGAATVSRGKCSQNNGVWIPGIDISGHVFLMVYSMLIMCEEANAFRRWNLLFKQPVNESPSKKAELVLKTKYATYTFIAMCALFCFWFLQITISCIHYHIWVDKVIAAAVAIGIWHVTYNIFYTNGFLSTPINRTA